MKLDAAKTVLCVFAAPVAILSANRLACVGDARAYLAAGRQALLDVYRIGRFLRMSDSLDS